MVGKWGFLKGVSALQSITAEAFSPGLASVSLRISITVRDPDRRRPHVARRGGMEGICGGVGGGSRGNRWGQIKVALLLNSIGG